jgi:steroid 5-alpha reductase family enzyme
MLSVKMRDATLVNFLWGLSLSLQSIIYFYKSLNYNIFSFWTEKFSWEKLTFDILVFAHGIRLSAYLILREAGKGEDRRYSMLREKLGNHFWWMSYFLVFVPAMAFNMILGSTIYAFANVDKGKIGHLSYWAGIFTMLFGGAFGALADIQKYTFRTSKRNEGKILDKGLWGISRHPNYLGEIVYWWGVYLVNFSAGILWTFICPVVLTFMILFISGIPVNEKVMHEEHGKEYEEDTKKVPIFIPFFGNFGFKGGFDKDNVDMTKGMDSQKDFNRDRDQSTQQKESFGNFGADNRQKIY